MSDIDPTPSADLPPESDPDLFLDAEPPPDDPLHARVARILLAGVVLIGMAAAGRTALEHAAAPPPGVTEPPSPFERSIAPGERTSVARYEFERARALR